MSESRIVANASPLICLAKASALHLLPAVHGIVGVPAAVMAELECGPGGPELAGQLRQHGWLEWLDDAPVSTELAAWDLGTGETAVIAWALAHPGVRVLLDDRAASRCARTVGLVVGGTLGLLLEAKQIGAVSQVAPVLDALSASGLWMSPSLRVAVLRRAGEA